MKDEGYEWEVIGGPFPQTKTWTEGEELVARLIEVKEINFQGRPRKVAVLEEQNGRQWSVWITFCLEPLAKLPPFSLVKIKYLGERKIKGGRRVKGFSVMVARESKPEPW